MPNVKNTIHNTYAPYHKDVDSKSAILSHNEGVDLIPANLELSITEVSLVNAMSREYALKTCLEPLKKDYDHIIIDCPPSLSIFNPYLPSAISILTFIPIRKPKSLDVTVISTSNSVTGE